MAAVIDHLIYGTPDLDETAGRWEEQGLTSYFGGTHPTLGTSNRIVPLGDAYIELLSPAPFDDKWVGWMIRGVPLGDDAVPMQRERPDGSVVRWRLAGLTAASVWELDPLAPVSIEWEEGTPLPGQVDPIGELSAVGFGVDGIRSALVTLHSGKEVLLY